MKRTLSFLLLLFAVQAVAQTAIESLKNGNKLYGDEKFDEAEIEYRKSLAEDEKNPLRAQFNLGDALYKQERYEEATEKFSGVAAQTEDSNLKSKALHNLGNSLTQQKKYKEAIEAYKNALKLNPGDDETRYNLAKTLKQLQKQNQQQKQKQNQEQKQDDKKEEEKKQKQEQENQDQQDPQKGGDEQKQNEEDQKDGEGKPDEKSDEQKGEKPKPQPGKISREDAERLLKAINKEEQDIQKKVNEKKMTGKPIKTEKDW